MSGYIFLISPFAVILLIISISYIYNVYVDYKGYRRCLHCSSVLPESEITLCTHCRTRFDREAIEEQKWFDTAYSAIRSYYG